MTGWETPPLPLRGARGSAARFLAMTLVQGLDSEEVELTAADALEMVQFASWEPWLRARGQGCVTREGPQTPGRRVRGWVL